MKAIRFLVLAGTLMYARNAVASNIPAVGIIEAPGVTCPSADAVQAALARLRGEPSATEPAFKLFVDRTAEVAHVDLRDGAGTSVLARDIPMTSADCDHAAEAIALIVERHFRSVEWSPGRGVAGTSAAPALPAARPAPAQPTSPPALSPASPPLPARFPTAPPASPATTPTAPVPVVAPPPPSPPPAIAEPPPASPPNVAATATAASAGPDHPPLLRFDPAAMPRLVLGAGPAFWSRGGTFAVALDGRWRVASDSPIQVGASVLLPPLHASTAVGAGSVHVGAVPLTGSVGLTEALGKLAVAAHLGVLWTIERGQSESIPAPATAWRTVLGLGLGASAAWPVTPRLRITGELSGYRTVLGRSYAVAGVPGTVLDPSPWQAVIVLGAEWVVLP